MQVRRVVTGHTPDGKATIASNEKVEATTVDIFPGWEFNRLWGRTTKQPSPMTAHLVLIRPTSHQLKGLDFLYSRFLRGRRQLKKILIVRKHWSNWRRSCRVWQDIWNPTPQVCTLQIPSILIMSYQVRFGLSWTMARRYTLKLETLLCRMVLVTPGATKVRSLAASLYASSVLAASDCRLVLEHKL